MNFYFLLQVSSSLTSSLFLSVSQLIWNKGKTKYKCSINVVKKMRYWKVYILVTCTWLIFFFLQSWTTVCPTLAVMAVLAMRKEWITRAHAVGTGSDSAVPIVCDLNLNVFQLLVSPIQKTCNFDAQNLR